MTVSVTGELKNTMRQTPLYGFKIAKRGYDVRYATSNQLLYDSAFPLLQIVMETKDGDWEVAKTGAFPRWLQHNGSTMTVWKHIQRKMHGLGKVPMVVSTGINAYNARNPDVYWDSMYIYSRRTFFSQAEYDNYMRQGAPVDNYMIFNVDITTDVEYPYVDDGIDTEWGISYDYGFKHFLTDNVTTNDPNELGLNANIQSMMVVAVKVATNSDPTVGLYTPKGIDADKLFPFSYIQDNSGFWSMGALSVQSASGYMPPTLDSPSFRLDGQTFAPKCSLVVVRSPMLEPDKQAHNVNM